MKLRITYKDPNALDEAINELARKTGMGLDDATDLIYSKLGEYIRLELDTETMEVKLLGSD